MCHGHGAAGFDLLFEQGDNAAIASEYVAETNGGKAGLAAVGKNLYDHLAQTLGGAHDVGRIHRLVSGDENEFFGMEAISGRGHVQRAKDVILDRLVRADLHQRHVLVRRGMEHDVRPILSEDHIHAVFVADGADHNGQVKVRIIPQKLLLDIIGVILIDLKDHKLLRLVLRDLPAELAADGASAARDQDRFAAQESGDVGQIDLDAVTPQKVEDRDVPDLLNCDLAVGKLEDAGQSLEVAVGLLANLQDIAAILIVRRRNGKNNLLDTVLLHNGGDVVAVARDLDSAQIVAALVEVVVHDTDDVVDRLHAGLKLAQSHRAGVAGADQEGSALHRSVRRANQHAQGAVADPGDADQSDQEQTADDGVTDRKEIQTVNGVDDEFEQADDRTGHGDVHQFIDTCKLPKAVI